MYTSPGLLAVCSDRIGKSILSSWKQKSLEIYYLDHFLFSKLGIWYWEIKCPLWSHTASYGKSRDSTPYHHSLKLWHSPPNIKGFLQKLPTRKQMTNKNSRYHYCQPTACYAFIACGLYYILAEWTKNGESTFIVKREMQPKKTVGNFMFQLQHLKSLDAIIPVLSARQT